MTLRQRWQQTAIHNKALVTTGIIGLLVTVFNVFVICFQVWLGQRNAAESSKQTDRLIANADRIAAAMDGSLQQSKASLAAAVDSSRADQRPWITESVTTLTKALTAGEKPVVELAFRNSGKTPALNANIIAAGFIGHDIPDEAAQNETPVIAGDPPKMILGPGITSQSIVEGMPAVTEEQIAGLQAGALRLYVVGIIRYEDVFGMAHETRYCVSTQDKKLEAGVMSDCVKGNYVR